MSIVDDALAEGFDSAPTDPFNPPKPKERPWFDAGDVALAIPRGIVGAAKGVYNLADTISGDALPDWKKNPLGESTSVIGGFVEGAAHFTAGFIPFGGGLGFAGVLPKLAVGASKVATIGRFAVASGAAGFAVFEGHEARLSDLIQRHESLANPVTEFLASNGDDPELLGRLKNAIEQAGLGAATEGLILGIKAVAKGRTDKAAALAAGESDETASKVASKAAEAVATPQKVIEAARDDQGLVSGGLGGSTLDSTTRRAQDDLASVLEYEVFKHDAAVKYPNLPTEAAQKQFALDEVQTFTDDLDKELFSAEAHQKYPDLPPNEAEFKHAMEEANGYISKIEAMDRADRRIADNGPAAGQPEQRAAENQGRRGGDNGTPSARPVNPWEMTPEQLDIAEKAAGGDERASAIQVFGEEDAAKYERLQRTANSANAPREKADAASAAIQVMEDSLTESQQNILFGKGETGPNAETLANFRRALNAVDVDSPEAMGKSLGKAMSELGGAKEIDPSKMTTREQVAFAQMQHAFRVAQEHGWNPAEIVKTGIKSAASRFEDPQDALFMLKRFFPGLEEDSAGFMRPKTGTAPDASPSSPKLLNAPPAAPAAAEAKPAEPANETAAQMGRRMRAEGATEAQIADAHLKAMGPEPVPAEPALPPDQARRAPVLRRLGLTDDKRKAFEAAFEAKGRAIEDTLGPGAGIPGQTAFNPRLLSTADRLRMGLKAADLPMQNFQSADATNVMMRTIEDFFRTEMAADFKSLAPTTLEQMSKEAASKTAEMLGYTSQEAYVAATQVRAGRTLNNLTEALPMMESDRTIAELANQRVVKILQQKRMVRSGEVAGNLDQIAVDFQEAVQHAAGMDAAIKGQAHKAGQILRALSTKVGGVEIPPELQRLYRDPVLLKRTLEDAGGAERVEKIMDKYAEALELAGKDGADAALGKLRQGTLGRRLLDMTTEFFMGSVLSSPQTWVINGTSPVLAHLFLPLERALGSSVIRGTGGAVTPGLDVALQQPIIRESLSQITELTGALKDSVRMFKDSGFNPQSALTSTNLAGAPQVRAISAAGFNAAEDSLGGKLANWFGSVVAKPLDILGGTDVIAKNTYYRSAATARLQTEGLSMGITEPTALAQHVHSRLYELTLDGQAYTSKAVIDRGIRSAKLAGIQDPEVLQKFVTDYYDRNFDQSLASLSKDLVGEAEVATYTNRALPDTITANIQNFISRHPALKLVAPFINTPMNLLKAAGQRADAIGVTRYVVGRVWPATMPEMEQTANRFLRDMLSNDPRKAADAVGRITVGMGAATFFTQQALTGQITGHGPSDPQQRQALIDTGWQPYSFKVGGSYVSYARLDPFATFVGTAADMAEYMHHAEDVNDEDHATAITGLAIGMANNFTNKSYLTGFANLVGALQAPEQKLPEFFRRQAAAFVPNILSTAGYGLGQDPNLREVHTLKEAIMSKIPGLSSTLPPRRNILGEPLERPAAVEGKDPVLGTLVNLWDPIKYSRVKDDVVKNEFAALGHSWDPPKRRTNGIDLMDVPVGKTNAYDRWQELQGTVTSGGMNLKDALRREIGSPAYQKITPESLDGMESPRVARLNKIVNDYRSRAWAQLLREKPGLKDHDVAYSANKSRMRAGLPASIIPGVQ